MSERRPLSLTVQAACVAVAPGRGFALGAIPCVRRSPLVDRTCNDLAAALLDFALETGGV